MIIKYLDNGTWNYIDSVESVSSKIVDFSDLVTEYNESLVGDGPNFDIASYMDGSKLDKEVSNINKVFLMACDIVGAQDGDFSTKNLIDPNRLDFGVEIITVGKKSGNGVALITNQRVFLMNDEGKTIEKLM